MEAFTLLEFINLQLRQLFFALLSQILALLLPQEAKSIDGEIILVFRRTLFNDSRG